MDYEAPIPMTCVLVKIPAEGGRQARQRAESGMSIMADAVWLRRPDTEVVYANWVSQDELVVFAPE